MQLYESCLEIVMTGKLCQRRLYFYFWKRFPLNVFVRLRIGINVLQFVVDVDYWRIADASRRSAVARLISFTSRSEPAVVRLQWILTRSLCVVVQFYYPDIQSYGFCSFVNCDKMAVEFEYLNTVLNYTKSTVIPFSLTFAGMKSLDSICT